MFNCSDYYSQTELCTLFKLSSKKLKVYIEANQILKTKRPVELGDNYNVENFNVIRIYVLKSYLAKFIA
jgi:hypothetical protein